jgi:hypothetical protein
VKQERFLGALGLSSSNLLHLSRRSLTSIERRFSEEFEESLIILVKPAFITLKTFLVLFISLDMIATLHLHSPVSHVEKQTDLLVLFPIFLLTRLGAVLDGLALAATFERGMSLAGEAAALGHNSDDRGR